MKRFTFNTGVKIWDNPQVKGGIDSGNGTIIIPFYCNDISDRAIFMFACGSDKLHENDEDIICREIHNSELVSKYAYFTIWHLNKIG